MTHEEPTNEKSFADLGYTNKHMAVLRSLANESENKLFLGVTTSLPAKYPLPTDEKPTDNQSMRMNQNWVDKALTELFAGQANKLKKIESSDRHALSVAVWKYAEDVRQALKAPAPDPVAALFGHCNKRDESQAAVRLIISWGVDPGNIPLLSADEAAEVDSLLAAEQSSLFEQSHMDADLPVAAV
jgi:hypothetical protein